MLQSTMIWIPLFVILILFSLWCRPLEKPSSLGLKESLKTRSTLKQGKLRNYLKKNQRFSWKTNLYLRLTKSFTSYSKSKAEEQTERKRSTWVFFFRCWLFNWDCCCGSCRCRRRHRRRRRRRSFRKSAVLCFPLKRFRKTAFLSLIGSESPTFQNLIVTVAIQISAEICKLKIYQT